MKTVRNYSERLVRYPCVTYERTDAIVIEIIVDTARAILAAVKLQGKSVPKTRNTKRRKRKC